ncbi:MAG: hypothetical protein KY450_14820, partial [Actinobacteria bacterium]|nr:hypothetical protein [Actinomycetota bacterium]
RKRDRSHDATRTGALHRSRRDRARSRGFGKPQKLPWEDWRAGDDEHTSAWMRATSPSGQAAYEGRVQWSGELGYGVRAPERGQSDDPALVPPTDVKATPTGPPYSGTDTAPGERTSDHHRVEAS